MGDCAVLLGRCVPLGTKERGTGGAKINFRNGAVYPADFFVVSQTFLLKIVFANKPSRSS